MTVRISGTNTTAAPGFQGGDSDTGIRPGTNEIEFVTGGSVAATFNSSGNLAFPDGQGIDFSATGNGSGTMSSELLDDYEEGSWTPTLTRNSGNPTVTYDQQLGYYTKIGSLVFVTFRLSTSAVSGGGGFYRVNGLPYTVRSGANTFYSQMTSVDHGNMTMASTDYGLGGYSTVGNNNITLIITVDTSGTRSSAGFTGWNSNSSLYMSGIYVAE